MQDAHAQVETIQHSVTCEQGAQNNEPHGMEIHTLWLLCFRHRLFVQSPAGGGSENTLGCRPIENLDRLRPFLDLLIENIDPDPEQQSVNEAEHQEGSEHLTPTNGFGDRISREQPLFKPILKKAIG